MRVKMMKTGESDRHVHLTMVVAGRNSGAVLVPTAAWEEFEDEFNFQAQIGTEIVCELTAKQVLTLDDVAPEPPRRSIEGAPEGE